MVIRMTDREKAIVMAYTGIRMLTGDKFQIFHKYVEDIMGRPIMIDDIGWLEYEIKEKSKADFMVLCNDESSSEKQTKWIPVSEKLPKPYTWVYATCKSLVDDRKNWVIDTCYVPNKKIAQEYMISDWGNVPMLNMGDAEVIAWMKWIRPEPYKVSPTEAESER